MTQENLPLSQQFFVLLILLFLSATLPVEAQNRISLPRTGLEPNDIAIIINENDPLSRQIGNYYQQARQIPATNIIKLRLSSELSVMTPKEFRQLKAAVDQLTPEHVQAFAVAWTTPYRVGCMSLTSALAFGFDKKYCAAPCEPTAPSPYFNSSGLYPYNDYKLRPAMMLAGTSFEEIKALIDRGIRSDYSFPKGQAYLMSTSDKARNTRAAGFTQVAEELGDLFPIQILATDYISERKDVLFYFTGLRKIPMLETLHFLPGALADHLTSAGGMLTDSPQMSSLRWLEAGATASYGTVVEPCSFSQKFPSPIVAMFQYASGASALEAYWKSVAWPGQGLFIGEPLAKPFAPRLEEVSPRHFVLKFFSPRTGHLRIERSFSAAGPFSPFIRQKTISRGENQFYFKFNEETDGYLNIRWH